MLVKLAKNPSLPTNYIEYKIPFLVAQQKWTKISINLNFETIRMKTLTFERFFRKALMHLAGFEPAMSLWEADYESDAFDHLATDAILELVGFEPTSIQF